MSQTALVTGSNRGIGLELCRQLKARGYDVIATCRHRSPALAELDVEIIEDVEVSDPISLSMFEVNSLGPLLTTQTLVKHMSEGSKVGIITSRMGSIADNDSGGSYAYRMSKAAVNAAGKSLSVDLKPKGIAVGILHPGWVRTDMTGHGGLIDADESASGLLDRMAELNIENTGTFWHMNGEVLPW
jgi:NAD(P)-dependent dehydrogenase (short-subunit alcohol dehydrogenase family)